MIPLRDNIPSRTFPFVVIVLIAACFYVFFVTLSLGSQAAMNRFVAAYSVIPAEFTGHARAAAGPPLPARLLTDLFLHGGWVHILGNMLFLWIFADNVEDAMGHLPFLAFYLICGVVANLAHILANPLSDAPTIGASGAIAGVLGAYLVLYPHARVLCVIPLWIFFQFLWVPAFLFLPVWIGLQLVSGLASFHEPAAGGVAWWAHVGGFAAGIALVRLFADPRRTARA